MGSFKIGKLKDGYIDFHNASYNEKQHRLKGARGTPRSSYFFSLLSFFVNTLIFMKIFEISDIQSALENKNQRKIRIPSLSGSKKKM